MTYKMRETDTHIYFVGGPFSQWFPSTFRAQIDPTGPLLEFNCGEQYMMASKAAIFNDLVTFDNIMNVIHRSGSFQSVPKEQKALGRLVKNFNPDIWDEVCRDVVFRANWAKFFQNDDLHKIILDSGDKILVEGSSYDRIWAVGLSWDDPRILNSKNWQGKNWLGQSLMEVRNLLVEAETNGWKILDPWTKTFRNP